MVMSDNSAFMMLDQPCDDAVDWLTRTGAPGGFIGAAHI